MRPLRLELKGFTAFRDATEIDFTTLDVFAISGPTGSGKSSLLDAMTYALYGRVERVGDRVGQLISQGQSRMAVTLEFEAGRDRYKVTRSTPAKGGTKIMLERQDGAGAWRQAGEGADRVREAEPLIVQAIGLTYDGFTRSILLPQGKFAEFLTGDAAKRRSILTELLGLSLFKRMAERAGATSKESGVRVQALQEVVEREYADATPEAVTAARRAFGEAERREAALAGAAERVGEILGRWERAQGSAQDLRLCSEELQAEAEDARTAAADLAGLGARIAAAAGEVADRAQAAEAAHRAHEETEQAIASARETWGTPSQLGDARLVAFSLAECHKTVAARGAERGAAIEVAAESDAALAEAGQTVSNSGLALAAAQERLVRAESDLEAVRHADLVAGVSAGLKKGDPCPVCGVPLQKPPAKAKASALSRAARVVDTKKKEEEAAAAAVARDLQAAAVARARLDGEIEELRGAIASQEADLADVLGEPFPADPMAEVDRRLKTLDELERAERRAAGETAEAAQALLRAEQDADRLAAAVERLRDRLVRERRPLLDRAGRALGEEPVEIEAPEPGEEAAELVAFAEALAATLDGLVKRMADEVARIGSLERDLLEEAGKAVDGLVEPQPTLEALAQAIVAAVREATAAAATGRQHADHLKERLASKQTLVEDIAHLNALLIEERFPRAS